MKSQKAKNNGVSRKPTEHSELLGKRVSDTKKTTTGYDPHLHRKIENPTTKFQTLSHFLKASMGTGILAMPEAFEHSGLVAGIISTFLIGALSTYCMHILIRSQQEICKKLKVPLLSYSETFRAACEVGPSCFKRFSLYAKIATVLFHIIFQLGLCSIYVVFVGDHLKKVADQYIAKPNSFTFYTVCLILPFLAILSLKSLKVLAPFSIVANLFCFITFGVVAFYILQDLPSLGYVPNKADEMSYALYFGTALFALESVNVVIALENNMANPKDMLGTFGVLNIGMTVLIFLFIFMGAMGYWRYCLDGLEPSITLNLPEDQIMAQIVMVLYSLAIYVSYGLQGFVGIEIFWTGCLENKLDKASDGQKCCALYLLRGACVIISFSLAIAVPLLGLFISLVGSFCLSALGFIFPAIIETCAYWPDKLGPGKWILWKDLVLVFIGILGLCCGSYSSIYGIVNTLKGYGCGSK